MGLASLTQERRPEFRAMQRGKRSLQSGGAVSLVGGFLKTLKMHQVQKLGPLQCQRMYIAPQTKREIHKEGVFQSTSVDVENMVTKKITIGSVGLMERSFSRTYWRVQ